LTLVGAIQPGWYTEYHSVSYPTADGVITVTEMSGTIKRLTAQNGLHNEVEWTIEGAREAERAHACRDRTASPASPAGTIQTEADEIALPPINP
jgi:hypothetical protein